jgi:excisionase family DNA binding protein
MAEPTQRDPFFDADNDGVRTQRRGVAEPTCADKPFGGDQLPAWIKRRPIGKAVGSSRSVEKSVLPPTRTGRGPLALPKQVLTVAETASFFQVSEKTIRRLIERGELPIVRIGRSVRIRQEVIETIVRQNE